MSERKKSQLRRWLIWTPAVLAVVGFGAMLVTEYRIGREIDLEIARLLRMGVDVRKIPSEQNLNPDYEELAEQLDRDSLKIYTSQKVAEQSLAKLEALAERRGVVVFPTPSPHPNFSLHPGRMEPLTSINLWWTTATQVAVTTRNTELFKRLFTVYQKLLIQIEGGWTPSQRWPLARTSAIYYLGKKPPQEVLDFLRAKFEEAEPKELVLARLARFGREARFGAPDDPQAMRLSRARARLKSWWETAVESQTLFKKSGDLAVLRCVRQMTEDALKSDRDPSDRNNLRAKLLHLLSQDKSWPASWAAERQLTVIPFPETDRTKLLHIAMIHLDLHGSRIAGKPLVPTWSKKYCFDPELRNAPIRVKATQTQLDLSVSVGGGGWSTSSGW